MKKLFSVRLLIVPVVCMLCAAGTTDPTPFPELNKVKLDNGLEIYFADYGSLPVTSYNFFINVGKKSETPGQQGLASMTADALLFGNEKYSRIEQDRLLYRLGADINASSNENYTLVSGEFLTVNTEEAIDLFSAVLLHPSFPKQDIDEARGFLLSQNKPSKMDIGDLADMFGNYFTYGLAHPLGRHFYESQLNRQTVEDMKTFYRFNYTPHNTKLVVIGKPDISLVKKLMLEQFGSWNVDFDMANGAAYDIPAIKGKNVAFVNKDGATQACLEWMKRAPDAGSKDMTAFRLANMIFSDRLMKDIREKRGFTYGIYSTYSEAMNDGIFRAKTQVRNDVMLDTKNAFDGVLADYFSKGATEAELKKFRNMMRTDIVNVEEPSVMAGLVNPWVYKDYEKRRMYITELNAIDLVTLNKVIKKYFTSDSYNLIIAGDAVGLGAQLQKFGNFRKIAVNEIEKDN